MMIYNKLSYIITLRSFIYNKWIFFIKIFSKKENPIVALHAEQLAILNQNKELIYSINERLTTLEALFQQSLSTVNIIELRSRTIEHELGIIKSTAEAHTERLTSFQQIYQENASMINVLELHSRTIEHELGIIKSTAEDHTERLMSFQQIYQENASMINILELRSRTIEHELGIIKNTAEDHTERLMSFQQIYQENASMINIIEKRSRSIEYELGIIHGAIQYQNEFSLKWYLETCSLGDASQKVILETKHSISENSQDHINPESTAEGLFRPTFFIKNCSDVLGENISFLDLGVGAGGLVYECLVNNFFAIGIEGSDFCMKYKVGYWPVLKNNLLLCDITKPFTLHTKDSQDNFSFEIITLWEVLEHIHEVDLNNLFENVFKHLATGGYFIGSISQVEYVDKNNVPYHVTLKSKEWWKKKFQKNGFLMLENHPFNENYFCRGVGRKYQDYYNYFTHPESGFHFVAQKRMPEIVEK